MFAFPQVSASVYLWSILGFVLCFKVKYAFLKAPAVQIVLQQKDLYGCSGSSMEVNEALHAAVYTYVWQDFGLSSLAHDLRRKSSSFKWEEDIFFCCCIYEA